MARILLGWEFGAGFGHISGLVLIAQALQRAGHTTVIAAAYPEQTRPVWEGKGIEVIGAPMLRRSQSKPGTGPAVTFADVLARIGDFTEERIVRLGQAWARMIAKTRPDVVVCEFAPNLAFQTLHRIPTITVGNGYSVPPAGRPFPAFPPRGPDETSPDSVRAEESILLSLNAAAAVLRVHTLEYVTDLFGGDEVFVCSLPELDCYRHVRSTPAIGSLTSAHMTPGKMPGTGVFAYLKRAEDLPAWIKGLESSHLPVEAYIKDSGRLPPLSTSIHMLEKLADLQQVLPGKAVLVHHGGTMAETAIRLGVPQLILPTQGEQRLTGALVAALGVGEVVASGPAREPRRLGRQIAHMAGDSKLRIAARDLAETIDARTARPALDVIVEAIGKYA